MTKIGLEVHVPITSVITKAFCSCKNPARIKGELKPNSICCPTCLGMPGSKPGTNKKMIQEILKIAIALNCKLNKEFFFSRKSYFYPDMSKNFQITQYEIAVGKDGYLELEINGKRKKIRIRRIQFEEDPAKLSHVGASITESDYVLVDYNRSGTPLAEIVTEPDFESPKEARIFLQKLTTILDYLKVFDPVFESTIRCDSNISIEGGERVEVKNISGAQSVEKALSYEFIRQKNLLRRGHKIVQETRAWDDIGKVTLTLRTKEMEEEYGYIFEPDLTRICVDPKLVKRLRKSLPELPDEKIKRYEKFGLTDVEATTIVSELELAEIFESLVSKYSARRVANIITGPLKKTLNYNTLRLRDTKITEKHIDSLLKLLTTNQITEKTAEMLLRDMIKKPQMPEKLIRKKGVERLKDENVIEKAVKKVLDKNLQAILDYKSGKKSAFHFLVGKVMAETKGRADPEVIRKLIKKKL